MNKIYKVIWSKAKNCYVVVSELAKRNGKCKASQTTLNRKKRLTDLLSVNTPALTKAVAAMLLAGLIAMPNVAGAATIDAKNGGNTVSPTGNTGVNNLAAGNKATAGESATAYGGQSTATGVNSTAIGVNAKALSKYSVGVGFSARAEAESAVAISNNARALTQSSIAIGTNSGITRNTNATYILNLPSASNEAGRGAVSIGEAANNFIYNFSMDYLNYENARSTVAIGFRAHTHAAHAVAIGASADAAGERSLSIGASSTDNNASHAGSRASGQGSIALGDQAIVLSDSGREYYEKEENYKGALSQKYGVPLSFDKTGAERSVDTNTNDGIAIGTRTLVMAKNGIAIGGNMSYSYEDANHKIKTVYGMSEGGRTEGAIIGEGAYGGIAIGAASGKVKEPANLTDTPEITIEYEAATTLGIRGIAIGSGARVATQTNLDEIQAKLNADYRAKEQAYHNAQTDYFDKLDKKNEAESILNATPTTDPEYETAKDAYDTACSDLADASTDLATARSSYEEVRAQLKQFEDKEYQHDKDAIAIGTNTDASIDSGIAIGNSAKTGDEAAHSTAIGSLAKTGLNASRSIAMGYKAETGQNARSSIAIGNAAKTGDTNEEAYGSIAIGYTATARSNDSIALGSRNISRGESSFSIGSDNTAEADDGFTLAIGDHNSATKKYATAIGFNNNANNTDSIAIGRLNNYGTGVTAGTQSLAIGTSNTVTGTKAISIGSGNTVTGDNSGAFGDPSVIDGANSYSVGNDNIIAEDDVFALGNNITTVARNSVFLGTNSSYTEGNSTAGLAGYGTADKPVTINGTDYTFAGAIPAGVVSVGTNVDGGERRIQNVAAGLISAESTDAINGSQLYAAMQSLSVQVIGDTDENTKSTNVIKTQPTKAGGTGTGTAAAGSVITLNPTTYEVKASTTTIDNTDGRSASGNLIIAETRPSENPKSYKYRIDLANNIKLNSVTTGNTIMNNNGVIIRNGPSMTKDGINAGNKKITNVAPGENDTDAVNVAQMRDYAAGNNQAISNVDNRARKGIAGAAALAALHPLDFDPDDKLTFAAGMGHYRGETAAALGMFYRPDEKVMFSLGGTVGNGENMVNAGISFSLDRTPRVTGSRTALTKEVVHLREQVARQDAQIAKQDQQIAMQGAQIAQLTALVSQLTGAKVNLPAIPEIKTPAPFPDNLDNKWAYDKLEELEQQGYIKGYAGRGLSRDEFAAALDRALAGGATLDERLVKEFEPELSHVRVAHVEGKGNEEGEWYERPRVSHDKLEKHEIDIKHIRVPVKPQNKK